MTALAHPAEGETGGHNELFGLKEEGYELFNWFTQVIVSCTGRNDQMKGR